MYRKAKEKSILTDKKLIIPRFLKKYYKIITKKLVQIKRMWYKYYIKNVLEKKGGFKSGRKYGEKNNSNCTSFFVIIL